MTDWEGRRLEKLLEMQLVQMQLFNRQVQLINRELSVLEGLLRQLVEAESPPTFNGTVGAAVEVRQ